MKLAGGTSFDYLGRMWKMRYLILSLVGNDIRTRYRRSFLGIGWSLVRPLSMTAIFCGVFQKIFRADMGDYVPHVLLGMTVWQFLAECLTGGCHSFARGSSYIRQQQLPLAIFPLRTVLSSAFHSLIALAVALAVTCYFKHGFSSVSALTLLAPSMILLLSLGWFLAILSGISQSHFPDTSHLLEVSLQFLFYLTPIVYMPANVGDRGRLSLIVKCNPCSYLLELVRMPIIEGHAPSLLHIQISLACVAVVGMLAWLMMRKNERTLVFWV